MTMQQRTITFDPGPHTYTDETGAPYISVTTLIGSVEPEYPARFWAMYRAVDQVGIYKPRPFLEHDSIEVTFRGKRIKFGLDALYNGVIPLNKSAASINAEWEEEKDLACEWGTNKHDYLEGCINKFATTNHVNVHEIYERSNSLGFAYKVTNMEELEASPLRLMYPTIYEQIARYIKAGWIAYAEKRIYSSIHKVAGTIDLLLVKNGKFLIIDWKTNKDKLTWEAGYYKKEWNADRSRKVKTSEFIKRNDCFLFPLNKLPLCKGNIYTLQLSLYTYICELWGLKSVGTLLCHIRPHLSNDGEVLYEADGITRKEHEPEFYKIAYKKAEVARLLSWRLGEIHRFQQPEFSI